MCKFIAIIVYRCKWNSIFFVQISVFCICAGGGEQRPYNRSEAITLFLRKSPACLISNDYDRTEKSVFRVRSLSIKIHLYK